MKPVPAMNFPGFGRHYCFAGICFLSLYNCAEAQSSQHKHRRENGKIFPARTIRIHEQLRIFDDSTNAVGYIVSLCADVPVNHKPYKVAHKQQTGHVFLILQKIIKPGDTLQSVFGYYPKAGLSTLLFKKVKSCIKDNSYREYDTKISRLVTREQFDTVISTCISLAQRRYHINRFNCYDYAVGVFNSIATDHPLPVTYVRFPSFLAGEGLPVRFIRTLKA